VARALRRTGTSNAMIDRVLSAIEPKLDTGTHVLDLAAESVGAIFPIARLPRLRTATRVLAFTGATGVGKTTSLVKLAARLAHAGRRVELATLDSRNVGAVEQLRAYSKLLAMPLTVIAGGARLNPGLFAAPSVDAILVDTSGTPAIDAEGLELLKSSLASVPVAFDTYAVLAASSSKSALENVTRALSILKPTGFIATKLDETTEPAVVLEHGLAAGWPLAFLSDGSDIACHFHRATADGIADLFLRGKLS
jgi:flagellar biosynthesis protein FlhF